jgi:hypothetical protein
MNEKRLRNVVNVHANARKDRRDVISLPQRAFGVIIIISCMFCLFVCLFLFVFSLLRISLLMYLLIWAMMICYTKESFFAHRSSFMYVADIRACNLFSAPKEFRW